MVEQIKIFLNEIMWVRISLFDSRLTEFTKETPQDFDDFNNKKRLNSAISLPFLSKFWVLSQSVNHKLSLDHRAGSEPKNNKNRNCEISISNDDEMNLIKVCGNFWTV